MSKRINMHTLLITVYCWSRQQFWIYYLPHHLQAKVFHVLWWNKKHRCTSADVFSKGHRKHATIVCIILLWQIFHCVILPIAHFVAWSFLLVFVLFLLTNFFMRTVLSFTSIRPNKCIILMWYSITISICEKCLHHNQGFTKFRSDWLVNSIYRYKGY